MFDKLKFKACVVASGKTSSEIASALGINVTTYYRKLRRNGDFSRKEICILIKILTLDNPKDIFFADKLT